MLALEYKKAKKRRESVFPDDNKEPALASNAHVNNCSQSFALLVLNASILEGVLRSILSEKVIYDIEVMTKKGLQEGRTEPSKAEQLMYKFRDELELQGGWDKLKRDYSFYLDLSLDKMVGSDITEAINVLFVLRNILAHGTAIVQPSEKINDDLKDVYPYSWQRKIQRASVYLKKVFGHDDVIVNLSEFDMPIHFLNITKLYLHEISKQVEPLPERSQKTLKMIDEYSFGYMHFSR